MAIVEMKRIDLLAMRQDQRKLLRTLQDMGCVEITPLQDEALAEYRTRDDGRLEQVDALLARLSWVIHECAAYNHQPAPFMGNLPEASAQDVHYITQQEAALQETLRQAETLEKRSGEYRGQLMRLQVAQSQLKPWLSFDLPMEQMHNTRRVAHFLGTVKAAELQQCQENGHRSPWWWSSSAPNTTPPPSGFVRIKAHGSRSPQICGTRALPWRSFRNLRELPRSSPHGWRTKRTKFFVSRKRLCRTGKPSPPN